MDSGLKDLLDQTATEADNDLFTHITTCDTIKRWAIKPNHQTDFWKGYCGLVCEDRKLCLAEKILPQMPIIVQLKLKFSVDNEIGSLYGDDFLAHICHIYQSVIIETIKMEGDALIELVVSVLESSSYYYEVDSNTGQKYLTTDIRLQFPFVKIDIGIQKRTIRPRVIKLLNETNCLTKLHKKPIGIWNQIISDDFDSPVMMYGSTENPDLPKLKLTHNWHWIDKDMIDANNDIDDLDIEDVLIPSNHKDVQNGTIEEYIFEENQNIEFWLPMFLSLDYWGSISVLKVEDDGKFNIIQEPKQKSLTTFTSNSLSDLDNPIELCKKVLSFLNKERYYEEPSWLDIGKAINISTKNSTAGFDLWVKHTEDALKANGRNPFDFMTISKDMKTTMNLLYKTFPGKPITEKTIGHYARIDNPENYATWHVEWCRSAFGKALNSTHTDVATSIYRAYWLDFTYCPKTNRWFIFRDGKWIDDMDALYIRGYISGDFINRLELLRYDTLNDLRNSNDETVIESGNSTIQKIDALVIKLKSVPYKNSILTELKTKFLNRTFDRACDANPNILGLANGVFEVVGGNIHFRAAKPEDYVLMNTNVSYDETLTWESPTVVACMTWFSQVFPDPKLKLHFLKFAASCVKGRNSDKIFPIFTGEGNNSKSMIVKLFTKTFGDYSIKFDMANVTGRNNNAGNASPHLARAKAVRLGFMDEAADDVPMHKETIKRVVGGDSFYTRKLHDNGGDIEVFFKLILSCNKVPIIPKADTAIKNRVKIFPFLGTWTSDASKLNEPNTYELRENFEDDIQDMVPAFLWILVQHYPIYHIEKLIDPEIVKKHTEEYWENNDVYAQFAGECVIVSKDNNSKVSFAEMFGKFRIWWKESFDGVKVPEKSIIKKDLQSRWGLLTGKYWFGISLVEDEYNHVQPVAQKAEQPVAQKLQQPVAAQQPIVAAAQSVKESEEVKQPKTPEAFKASKKFIEISKKNKNVQETMGDIPTKLWSPGIMAGVSGEINLEEDGAVDI